MEKLLIVVDMQNDFVDGALGTPEAVKIVGPVADKIRAHQGPVVFTRDTHRENYPDTQEGKNLPVVHCVKGTHGWQLNPEINLLVDGREIFDKPTFGSIELSHYVASLYQSHQIDSVELIGLCTDICVLSNAILLKAVEPEMKVSVDGSCCAGVTPESHRNALEAMKMCQVEITGTYTS